MSHCDNTPLVAVVDVLVGLLSFLALTDLSGWVFGEDGLGGALIPHAVARMPATKSSIQTLSII